MSHKYQFIYMHLNIAINQLLIITALRPVYCYCHMLNFDIKFERVFVHPFLSLFYFVILVNFKVILPSSFLNLEKELLVFVYCE